MQRVRMKHRASLLNRDLLRRAEQCLFDEHANQREPCRVRVQCMSVRMLVCDIRDVARDVRDVDHDILEDAGLHVRGSMRERVAEQGQRVQAETHRAAGEQKRHGGSAKHFKLGITPWVSLRRRLAR